MISREEVKKIYKLAPFKEYAESLIDSIYNDIGTCKECKYLKEKGVCSIHSEDVEENVIMLNDDFCSYFIRKETK